MAMEEMMGEMNCTPGPLPDTLPRPGESMSKMTVEEMAL